MDDLESLGYTLLYLQMGKLPWSTLVTYGLEDDELYKQIEARKRHMRASNLQVYFKIVYLYAKWNMQIQTRECT